MKINKKLAATAAIIASAAILAPAALLGWQAVNANKAKAQSNVDKEPAAKVQVVQAAPVQQVQQAPQQVQKPQPTPIPKHLIGKTIQAPQPTSIFPTTKQPEITMFARRDVPLPFLKPAEKTEPAQPVVRTAPEPIPQHLIGKTIKAPQPTSLFPTTKQPEITMFSRRDVPLPFLKPGQKVEPAKPVVVQPAPKPVVIEAKPQPVIIEEKPQPIVIEEKPQPIIVVEQPQPVIVIKQQQPQIIIQKADPVIYRVGGCGCQDHVVQPKHRGCGCKSRGSFFKEFNDRANSLFNKKKPSCHSHGCCHGHRVSYTVQPQPMYVPTTYANTGYTSFSYQQPKMSYTQPTTNNTAVNYTQPTINNTAVNYTQPTTNNTAVNYTQPSTTYTAVNYTQPTVRYVQPRVTYIAPQYVAPVRTHVSYRYIAPSVRYVPPVVIGRPHHVRSVHHVSPVVIRRPHHVEPVRVRHHVPAPQYRYYQHEHHHARG